MLSKVPMLVCDRTTDPLLLAENMAGGRAAGPGEASGQIA
jgi:hypothetical protein